MNNRVFYMVLCALAVVLAVVAWDTVIVYNNRDSIAQRRAEIQTIRNLDYRVCVRIDDTRGIQLLVLRHTHYATPALVNDLVMYECDPRIADGVTIMTAKEQAAYLRMLLQGKKPGP